jgi:hypothetical protein
MMVSQALSSSMLLASFSGGTSRPMSGPLPPGFEVVKNTGSMWSKSRSSCMRPISTDPTIPRQPINPTFIMFVFPCNRIFYREGRQGRQGKTSGQTHTCSFYGLTSRSFASFAVK